MAGSGALFAPMEGVGAAYAIILNDFDGSVSGLHVHNNWGLALQAGIEYRLSRRWELFVDYKRLWLDVKAEGFLANERRCGPRDAGPSPDFVRRQVSFLDPVGGAAPMNEAQATSDG